ncbi:hypothetical protein PILCRDRAFT_365058 [Piloderma croceum F 1598]|uniref:Uncharacterized protein n=1 Tax=Piloderma croceum (strain F 1598) TaxID=765440 RepID=A0A0C3BGQ3_PILCF|nr:hypothetical protein PILCRDRAFT_365058 [Piloderma croceum F 1598]
MTTPYLPGLSIIDNHKFDVAPANMSATATNVARIFKPLEVKEDTPFNIGILSISPGAEAFKEKRYWQLPVSAAAIFAALVARLQNDLSGCEDIVLAKKIVAHLTLKRYSGPSSSGGPRGDSGGPSGGGGGGEGPSGGERRRSKRKNASGESSAPAKEGNRKARNVAGGDEAGDCGECSGASSEALRSFLVPLGPSWNVEFPPGVRSQYGQSNRREIAFGDDKPAKLIDADKDNSDSETGRSISAINPPDEDNPDEWRFGPSFSTNKIVFTARAVKLT